MKPNGWHWGQHGGDENHIAFAVDQQSAHIRHGLGMYSFAAYIVFLLRLDAAGGPIVQGVGTAAPGQAG
jgi:hypothetical protein